MKRLYEELGLVNTREVFKKAMEGGYAIPAYNFNNMEQLQAIMIGCAESKSPVILQVSKGAREYANQTLLRYMAMGAIKMVREMGSNIPVTLHLDHGDSFETCKSCMEACKKHADMHEQCRNCMHSCETCAKECAKVAA